MKFRTALALSFALWAVPAVAFADAKLEGTWSLDVPATVKLMTAKQPLPPDQLKDARGPVPRRGGGDDRVVAGPRDRQVGLAGVAVRRPRRRVRLAREPAREAIRGPHVDVPAADPPRAGPGLEVMEIHLV